MNQEPRPSANPFLVEGATERLPPFESLRAAHIEPGIRALVDRLMSGLLELEAKATPTWNGTIAALEALTEPLFTAWGVVQHLMGVQNSPELRAAHDAVQKEVVQASMRVAQSEPIYRAMLALRSGPAFRELDVAQQRIVTGALREAELSGVGLSGAPKQRFEQIELELAELSTRFMNNVLDETKAFSMMLTREEEVGSPGTELEFAL